jgi:hypothetical protein
MKIKKTKLHYSKYYINNLTEYFLRKHFEVFFFVHLFFFFPDMH